MTGKWEINIALGSMPEVVATAFSKLNGFFDVEYVPIAYLGSQIVDGTNYAVLAEQILTASRANKNKNIVVIIFNQHSGQLDATLVNIERVVESFDGDLGSTVINVKTEIPDEAMDAYYSAIEGYVGFSIKPFALLGKQITNGTNYIFAATVDTGIIEENLNVVVLTANSTVKEVFFTNILTHEQTVLVVK